MVSLYDSKNIKLKINVLLIFILAILIQYYSRCCGCDANIHSLIMQTWEFANRKPAFEKKNTKHIIKKISMFKNNQ